ncbi:hypothetical protein OE88DRAFT_1027467 [Heliocybe sulcata]|uniref:SnoaL-like domain-containing protein n=1 Tax=Heliocybe sulcata TaxID=5364 RepID=A0A5C3ND58_9AGAM|nr:hypothetical protein OE88DRAFT_1027467 [Heliocybe sulcata]
MKGHHHSHHDNQRSSFQLPPILPTPSLIESLSGASHYSGATAEHHDKHSARKSSEGRRPSAVMELSDQRKQVIDDLKELFCCRPTREIFDRSWREDAVFEDPLCSCKGRSEYAAQWYGLARLASKSENLAFRVISSTVNPNRIVFSQRQQYNLRIFGKKVIASMVVVDLDDKDKIIRLADKWNGEEASNAWVARSFRRLDAKMAKWTVKIPSAEH